MRYAVNKKPIHARVGRIKNITCDPIAPAVALNHRGDNETAAKQKR